MIEIFESIDFVNNKKIFPVILKNVDKENQIKIITSLVHYIFNNLHKTKSDFINNYENTDSKLLRAFNHEKDPIQTFTKTFG